MSGAFGGGGGAYHKDKLDSPSTGSEDGNIGMAGIGVELPEIDDFDGPPGNGESPAVPTGPTHHARRLPSR